MLLCLFESCKSLHFIVLWHVRPLSASKGETSHSLWSLLTLTSDVFYSLTGLDEERLVFVGYEYNMKRDTCQAGKKTEGLDII